MLAATIIRTPLTSHPTYQAWTQAGGTSPARTAPDRLLTTSLDAMIKMQSVAYPVFNAFRNGLEGVLKAVH